MTDQPGCPCSICDEDHDQQLNQSDCSDLRTRIVRAVIDTLADGDPVVTVVVGDGVVAVKWPVE